MELVVALALAGLVLGTATTSVLRQQRIAERVGVLAATESQSRAAITVLRGELAGLSPAVGDLVAGEATDTSLQLRVVVVAGSTCASEAGQVTLAADDAGDGIGALPRTGDSLWTLTARGDWTARRITDVRAGVVSCSVGGSSPSPALHLVTSLSDTTAQGTPVRVARQLRYVFYRSGDGTWQLGLREWSEATNRLSAPQPVAGPFVRRALTGERTGFRYFDSTGAEVVTSGPGADVARVARVRVGTLVADRAGIRRDSVDVALYGGPAH